MKKIALTLALVLNGPPGFCEPADGPDPGRWGVGYKVDGMLNIREGRPVLNTPDGRLFLLEMREAEAREFDGATVLVGGKVVQADAPEVVWD